MSIKIRTPLLYKYRGDDQAADVNGSTVGECLDDLIRIFPELKEMLRDERGNLHDHLHIYVNQKDYHPEGMATPVKNGDKIDIIVIIQGG